MNDNQNRFLNEFKASCGNVKRACERSGISRMTYYRWIKQEAFRNELDVIIDNHYSELNRIINSVLQPRFNKTVTRYKNKTVTTIQEVIIPSRVVLLCLKITFKIEAYYEKRYLNESKKPIICKVFALPTRGIFSQYRIAA